MPDRDRPKKPFGKPLRPGARPWREDRDGGQARPRGAGGAKKPFRAKERGRGRGPDRTRERDGPVVLYGWHTVKAAVENPRRRFHRLLATENAARRLTEEGLTLPLEPEIVRPDVIDAMVGADAVHQGLIAEVDALPSLDIADISTDGMVLVLDQITDPHNVGAILRSAAAFAVSAVVTTARHSPDATGVLAKAASGALDYVPMVTVGNLARALGELKDAGWMVVGLDSAGSEDLAATQLRAPLALVVGAEGKGLRQLTRTTCDVVARIDLPGRIGSLNVSNATALSLYVAFTRLATA